jgi:hypothetical protein
MTLPDNFRFSQRSLQDYVDCNFRFDLRYQKQLQWPAVESVPLLEQERRMKIGARFHRMVQQHRLGLAAEVIEKQAADPELEDWWRNYLAGAPQDLPPQQLPEVSLVAPLAGYQLSAKYDLLAFEPGRRAVIVDWKTGPKRQKRDWLLPRLQTMVYPFVLVEGSAFLNGGQRFKPDQVEMLYWFAAEPGSPERIRYDATQHEGNRSRLERLVSSIVGMAGQEFPRTMDEEKCRFCVYRSYCDRGIESGHLDDLPEDLDWEDEEDFNLEQVGEAAF